MLSPTLSTIFAMRREAHRTGRKVRGIVNGRVVVVFPPFAGVR